MPDFGSRVHWTALGRNRYRVWFWKQVVPSLPRVALNDAGLWRGVFFFGGVSPELCKLAGDIPDFALALTARLTPVKSL